MKKWLVVHFKWAFFSGWSRHVDMAVHMACLRDQAISMLNTGIFIYTYIYMKVTHCHKCHCSFMSAKAGTDRCLFLFDIVMCTWWQCQTTLWFFFLFCLFGFLPVITHEEHVGHSEGDLEPAPVCDKVGEQRKDEETHTEEHLVQDTHCSPVLHTNNLCD